jgi:ribosome biogenesis GTPase
MAKMDDLLNFEEEFFSFEKRESRAERKVFRSKDRSKHKKSNRDQKEQQLQKEAPPLGGDQKRGRVITLTPERIYVAAEGETFLCSLKGVLKKERTKQKTIIAVGDFVHFTFQSAGEGSITHIEKRTSFLARSDSLSRRKQHLIAVNIDQVFIVTSLFSPKFKPLLIDRYIISAKKGNMKPIIIINKTDLLSSPPSYLEKSEIEEEKWLLDEFLAAYTPLEVPILLTSVSHQKNLTPLKKTMEGKASVFSGQSGVGKSSLLNALLGLDLPTKEIVIKTQKGAHATITAELIPIEGGGFCIDTPGIKSFGIWDLTPQEIQEYFPDFASFALQCQFPNCTHLHEPNCAVKAAVEAKKIPPLRYASYTTLIRDEPLKEWE